MRTAITVFLLKTHAITNKKMSEKITREKFVDDMLKAHKIVVQEAWVKWEDLVDQDLERMHKGKESEIESKYPHGFYSFLTAHLDHLIAENKGEEKVEKPVKKGKK